MTPVQNLLAKLSQLGCPDEEALALVTAIVQCGKTDLAAEKRRKWDREYRRKKKLSGGNPPECVSGGIQVELTDNQVEIHPTNAVISLSIGTISNGNISNGTISNSKISISKNSNGTISNGRQLSLIETEFDQVWKIYPNKKSKKESERAFHKARKKVSIETITDALYAYIANTEQQYLAHLATWLNQERWTDEYAKIIPLAKPLTPRHQILKHNMELENVVASGSLPDPRTESPTRSQMEILPALAKPVDAAVSETRETSDGREAYGDGYRHAGLP